MSGQLLELRIKDFAIIDELRLELQSGLNALTGETGAGKSILIDALGAVLGERTSPTMVRAGADRAVIEATFGRPDSLPEELELDEADEVIILSREIGSRGAARINGRSVPLSMLQLAGRELVDVHGQSDHQSLFRPSTHLFLLDRFAGLDAQRDRLAGVVRELRQVRQELASLQGDSRELARQQDLLRFQLEEIDAASLASGEDEELSARRTVLANAERLREVVSAAIGGLSDDGQAIDASLSAAKQLSDAARLDGNLAGPAEQLDAAAGQLQDVSRELSRYLDAVEADPEELQRVDDRLDLIRGLKRKYGESIEDVLAFADNARAKMIEVLGADQRIEDLQVEGQRLSATALEQAQTLSGARRSAIDTLTSAVEAELADLNMASARFSVSLDQRDEVQPSGIDAAEFLLSANRGEPLRPLAQVASGGEASRLMLALKSVFSAVDDTPVLVFDEIEVGVGARSGHVIGHKLRSLAERHQVLCITHLAPVAALADAHFKVRKLELGDRTGTAVDRLDEADRIDELAEMLAGKPVTEASKASARELLNPVLSAAPLSF